MCVCGTLRDGHDTSDSPLSSECVSVCVWLRDGHDTSDSPLSSECVSVCVWLRDGHDTSDSPLSRVRLLWPQTSCTNKGVTQGPWAVTHDRQSATLPHP